MVYVVGCNHGIQPDPSGPFALLDGAAEQDQRSCFAALLEAIFKRGKVQFVGEEWGDVETTIPKVLANKRNIPYRDINTSDADKERMGIPCDYVKGPYTDEQKKRWDRQREQFMFERIQEHRGNARNFLIVCGFAHLEGLSGLLGQEGTTVEPVDYRKREWYRPGVFREDA